MRYRGRARAMPIQNGKTKAPQNARGLANAGGVSGAGGNGVRRQANLAARDRFRQNERSAERSRHPSALAPHSASPGPHRCRNVT
jgi:hypothetical protein